MTKFRKFMIAIAAVSMTTVIGAPAFAAGKKAAAEPVCPLTQPIKRSVDYCAAKGLVPGTVYGCVAPRTQQQVTCSTPAPYVAPVQTYIAPVARSVHTVDRCPDGTAPDRDPRDGVYKCPPVAHQVAIAPVVTQRVIQQPAPAPTYSAYNAPAPQKACTYCNMEFAEMSDTVVPTQQYSSDYRYGKTVDGVVGLAQAGATAWGYDRIGKGLAGSGSTTTINNGGAVDPVDPVDPVIPGCNPAVERCGPVYPGTPLDDWVDPAPTTPPGGPARPGT